MSSQRFESDHRQPTARKSIREDREVPERAGRRLVAIAATSDRADEGVLAADEDVAEASVQEVQQAGRLPISAYPTKEIKIAWESDHQTTDHVKVLTHRSRELFPFANAAV